MKNKMKLMSLQIKIKLEAIPYPNLTFNLQVLMICLL